MNKYGLTGGKKKKLCYDLNINRMSRNFLIKIVNFVATADRRTNFANRNATKLIRFQKVAIFLLFFFYHLIDYYARARDEQLVLATSNSRGVKSKWTLVSEVEWKK